MEKKVSKSRKRINSRIIIVLILFTLVFILQAYKLVYIQIYKHQEYLEKANNQRTKKIDIFPSRGYIFDRNDIPLTNRRREKVLYVNKPRFTEENKDKLIKEIVDITGIDENKLIKMIDNANSYELIEVPFYKDYKGDNNNNDYRVLNVVKRYDNKGYLSHVIGYENNNGLGTGVEHQYSDLLKNDKLYNYINIALDGKYGFWEQAGYKQVVNKSDEYRSIKLSIDYHIQKISEDVFDNNNYVNIDKENRKGAVVVADVETGDILAMISRPNFDLNDLGKHLDSKDENFINRAIAKSYPPASIFKSIVMIAALEEDKVDLEEKFICNGYEELDGNIIKCHSYEDGGHGEIDIYEAFNESCNSTFIQLGKRIGSKKIIEVAKRFGFGEKVMIGLDNEEKKGNLPKGDELYGPSVGLHSIGQGSIEATPIQITNMMLTIANSGVMKDMTLYLGYTTSEGKTLSSYNREEDKRIFDEKYSYILKEMMEGVVTKGTASKYINLDEYGGAAGKTGTAQIGNNDWAGWFSGYFPKDNPKYVITVLVEDVNLGGKYAGSIFNEIAQKIIKIKK